MKHATNKRVSTLCCLRQRIQLYKLYNLALDLETSKKGVGWNVGTSVYKSHL